MDNCITHLIHFYKVRYMRIIFGQMSFKTYPIAAPPATAGSFSSSWSCCIILLDAAVVGLLVDTTPTLQQQAKNQNQKTENVKNESWEGYTLGTCLGTLLFLVQPTLYLQLQVTWQLESNDDPLSLPLKTLTPRRRCWRRWAEATACHLPCSE